jgi:hypothetical protein
MASSEEIDGLERARVLGVKGREEFAAGGMISDSGTRRRETGSLPPGALVWRLGRPRAAAAPMERSVVREARRAASWSAWLELERCVRGRAGLGNGEHEGLGCDDRRT